MKKEGIKKLAKHYFSQIAHDPDAKSDEVLEAYADNFIADMQRYILAANDFKNIKED